MRRFGTVIVTAGLVCGSLYASDHAALQAHIDQDRLMLRELNARATKKSSSPMFDKLDDDGTIPANLHQPTKEALKLAEKAEREAAKNQHERAAEHLRAALAADPEFVEAEHNLALDLLALHQNDEAIAHLRHIVATHPERLSAFNTLGSVLCELKRYPQAEAVAREALKTHPLSFTSNLILGLTCAAQGKFTAQAKQALQYASAQRPEAKALLAQWPSHP